MTIDAFIAAHEREWERLDALTRRRPGRLSPHEIDELVELYQRVSAQLSYARTYFADPALVAALTRRAAAANALVYGTRPRSVRALARFLTHTFPAAVWHLRRFCAVSAAALFIPAVAVALWLSTSSETLERVAPQETREAYVREHFAEYYRALPSPLFGATVTTNNIRVGALAFAVGIAFAVPAGLVLAYNGAQLGVAAALHTVAGALGQFFALILPHGLLELTAIVVAGATGLRLGWTLVDPGDRPRAAALTEEGRRAVAVVVGLALVFVVAGVIEGFVTNEDALAAWQEVAIGALAWAGFVVYVVRRGRAAAAQGITGAIGEERASGWAA